MPALPPPSPSGFGSFTSATCSSIPASGQSQVLVFCEGPVIANGCRQVIITSADAALPNATVTDSDGNTYSAVTALGAKSVTYQCTLVASHAVGFGRVRVVPANALAHFNGPSATFYDFKPSGQ